MVLEDIHICKGSQVIPTHPWAEPQGLLQLRLVNFLFWTVTRPSRCVGAKGLTMEGGL